MFVHTSFAQDYDFEADAAGLSLLNNDKWLPSVQINNAITVGFSMCRNKKHYLKAKYMEWGNDDFIIFGVENDGVGLRFPTPAMKNNFQSRIGKGIWYSECKYIDIGLGRKKIKCKWENNTEVLLSKSNGTVNILNSFSVYDNSLIDNFSNLVSSTPTKISAFGFCFSNRSYYNFHPYFSLGLALHYRTYFGESLSLFGAGISIKSLFH
jgi:hypothetical protein